MRPRQNSSARPAEVPAEITEQQRALFSSAALAQIARKIDQEPMIKKAAERRRVANNMWGILTELERRSPPIKKRAVLQAANLSDGIQSTKALPRYAINPALNEEEQTRKAEGLTKKIQKYANLARCAARLSNQRNDDHFIPRLVEGTHYAVLSEVPNIDKTEANEQAWSDIQSIVSIAAQGIAAMYQLGESFEALTAAGRTWMDPEVKYQSRITYLGIPPDRSNAIKSALKAPLPALVGGVDLLPCPSVVLGTIRAYQDIDCTIHLRIPEEYYQGADDDLDRLLKKFADADLLQASFMGRARPMFRVRLELRPHGDPAHVVPMLRLRPCTELRATEAFTRFADFDLGEPQFKNGDKIAAGELLGFTSYPLTEGLAFEPYSFGSALEVAAFIDGKSVDLSIEQSVDFGKEVEAAYAESVHSRVPFGGSLLVAFDDNARAYLKERLETDLLSNKQLSGLPTEVEDELLRSDHSGIERLQSPFFDNASLLAALERSLSPALGQCGLIPLLDAKAKVFATEAAAELKRHEQDMEEQQRSLQDGLVRLQRNKEAIARQYGIGNSKLSP